MTSRVLINVTILLATIALAVVAVRWADREFQRVEPPSPTPRPSSWADWIWALNRPYRRFQHDWLWVCVAATAGMAAIGALDARARSRPGTIIVTVAFLVGVVLVAHYLLAAPAISRTKGDCYGLRNALEFRLPGAILGAFVASGRKLDWWGLLLGSMWMVEVVLLVAYGLLFG